MVAVFIYQTRHSKSHCGSDWSVGVNSFSIPSARTVVPAVRFILVQVCWGGVVSSVCTLLIVQVTNCCGVRKIKVFGPLISNFLLLRFGPVVHYFPLTSCPWVFISPVRCTVVAINKIKLMADSSLFISVSEYLYKIKDTIRPKYVFNVMPGLNRNTGHFIRFLILLILLSTIRLY